MDNCAGMPDEKYARLEHLAQTLKQLPPERAYSIIKELENDVAFDRTDLKYLAAELINLQTLLSEIPQTQLSCILQPLETRHIAALFNNLDDNLKPVMQTILGKNRFQEIVNFASSNKTDLDSARQALLTGMGNEIAMGRVSYDGLAAMLITPPCRPYNEPSKNNKRVLFQVIYSLIGPDDGIKVLIYAPGMPCAYVRLAMVSRTDRYWNKDSGSCSVRLDANGFFFDTLFPEVKPGHSQIAAHFPGSGEAFRSIWNTRSPYSYISVNILDCVSANNTYTLAFIVNNLKAQNSAVTVEAYCSHCGVMLDAANSQLENYRGKINLRREAIDKHDHDIYLHITAENERQVLERYSFRSLSGPPLHTEEFIDTDHTQPIQVALPLEQLEPFFVHVSTSAQADQKLMKLIETSEARLRGAAAYQGNTRETMIEKKWLYNESREFHIFRERQEGTNFSFNIYNNHYEYIPVQDEILSDLFFTFYRLTENGLAPFLHFRSLKKQKPLIVPFLPKYLNDGETLQAPVGYFLPRETDVTISNLPKPQNLRLQGRGVFYIQINGAPATISAPSILYENTIHVPARKILITQWMYLPEGESIDPENYESVTIYPSPVKLLNDVMNKMLVNYPWGCAEQTAAKLAAFALLLSKNLQGRQSIVRMINAGVDALIQYRTDSGLYRLFDTSTEYAGALVYSNLRPIENIRSIVENLTPRLFKVLDELTVVLKNVHAKEIVKSNGNNVTSVFDLETDRILKEAGTNLTFNNGFAQRNKGYESLGSLASRLCAYLIQNGKDQVTVFDQWKEIRLKKNTRGIRKFLETVKLVKPLFAVEKKPTHKNVLNALHHLLKIAGPANWEGSYSSTLETIGFINLLDTISRKTKTWNFLQNENPLSFEEPMEVHAPIAAQSPYAYVHISKPHDALDSLCDVAAFAPQLRLKKRQKIEIIFSPKSHGARIVHLLLPAVAEYSGANYSPESQKISFECHREKISIMLFGKLIGSGMLSYLVENMSDPRSVAYKEIGIMEVFEN